MKNLFSYKQLPPKECFYSSLGDEIDGHVSDEQYLHLKNICKIFNLNTFEDFHNHYLKKDILLLAESFEKFISTSLKCYNLDSCHYLSAPGLSWDAMLKMTKVKVEKISDPDKYLFFEQGMRGGVSYINKRYNEASKNVNILYFDANNLYGHATNQYLPINNFKWVKNTNKIEKKLMRIKTSISTGYILAVDLEYPEKLHDIHNDYPLATGKINITKE